jgi:hypothetical protein
MVDSVIASLVLHARRVLKSLKKKPQINISPCSSSHDSPPYITVLGTPYDFEGASSTSPREFYDNIYYPYYYYYGLCAALKVYTKVRVYTDAAAGT